MITEIGTRKGLGLEAGTVVTVRHTNWAGTGPTKWYTGPVVNEGRRWSVGDLSLSPADKVEVVR